MILGLLDETVQAGARQAKACDLLGLDVRTVQRWRRKGIGEDCRAGPKSPPANRLSDQERRNIVAVVNLPEHRDLSPKQIVPKLADEGRYLASESTIYRVLGAEGLLHHRERSRPPAHHKPRELRATAPNQVWTWDITYLRSPIKGIFFYLYVVVDVFSRKIVGHAVHAEESAELAKELVAAACAREGVQPDQLVLHQDNGSAMRSGTFLALLQCLGVAASFSRPGVSDDNPYVEALFRTFKYRPEYPSRPFASLAAARAFVHRFVAWYNTEHRHSGIRFVTPAERHAGQDREILAQRREVYEQARARNPERWSGCIRNWTRVDTVVLNPDAHPSRKECVA